MTKTTKRTVTTETTKTKKMKGRKSPTLFSPFPAVSSLSSLSALSTVAVRWEAKPVASYERFIQSHAGAWLVKRGGGLVSVLMTDTPTVQSFNRKYRGVPTPTAVMSFPQNNCTLHIAHCTLNSKNGFKKSAICNLQSAIPFVWGDVVIAVDAVKRYARLERTTPGAILKEFLDHGLRGLVKS